MTLYLLVLVSTWISPLDSSGRVVSATVVAQFTEPYDCEAYRASLTGSTRPGEYLVCIPAKDVR